MAGQVRKIVVGTSFDAASDRVVRAALLLREKTGAELHLVHGYIMPISYDGGVFGLHTPLEADPTLGLDPSRLSAQLERVGASAADFAGVVVLAGAGDQLINRVGDEIGADLLVVGSSETSPGLQPILGSTADRVLRRSTRPVLVVRGDFAPPRRVLAPTDLSPLSENALGRGLGILEDLGGGAEIDALFVLNPLDREGSVNFQPEQMDRFALEQLETLIGRLPGRGAGTISSVLRHGHARSQILDYLAAQPGIDLLLLGTHGRGGFERFLLGSVTSELLRRIEVSALVVPPEVRPAGFGA